ncbi:hypothetical protein L6452_06064 [Arctium lappa]|uniref:Uncharacterized protein n=1 Tax=Arctium lappa TaxID=4217 RepID=A0ACB9EID8_ARCLA|nr:hypothetical protein L6452_06064 [Arctium lappa]
MRSEKLTLRIKSHTQIFFAYYSGSEKCTLRIKAITQSYFAQDVGLEKLHLHILRCTQRSLCAFFSIHKAYFVHHVTLENHTLRILQVPRTILYASRWFRKAWFAQLITYAKLNLAQTVYFPYFQLTGKDLYKSTGKEIWDYLEWTMLGPTVVSVLKGKISELEAKIQQIVSVESNEQKVKKLESENAELRKNISDLEQKINEDKVDFEKEKKSFSKKFSDFSKKCYEEKKSVELKCIKLSQQISDFEKVLILEREKFDKEKKAIEQKNVGFFKELSGQRNDSEKGFEEQRSIFESEIKRLTSKLSELSASALKEQRTKSKFSKKIDQLEKERVIFESKIKELEKSVSSSTQKSVSSQRSVKYFNQIRRSNIFFDEYLYDLDTSSKRKGYKKEKLVWMKKSVKDDKKDELNGKTSCVHVHRAKKNKEHKGKPDLKYSKDQLLRSYSNTQMRTSTIKGEYTLSAIERYDGLHSRRNCGSLS